MTEVDVPCAERTPPKLAFLVQGLFEISDSIGYDCVYQYKIAAEAAASPDSVRIFAERFERERHPGVPIEPMDEFLALCDQDPDVIVVYHYCGAWLTIDRFLQDRKAPFIVRWHNNTPPWFFMDESPHDVMHTLEGFENIVALACSPNAHFWVNSEFTRRQLLALGGPAERSSVVFPASRYLAQDEPLPPTERSAFAADGFALLFVGRVVSHKGHCAMVATAARLGAITNRPVTVHIAGRESAARRRIEEAAERAGINVRFHGEVSEDELRHLYARADVFLCLSEHEGFGLPVFEAMRSGVPVVAWSCTAFTELLADHPLAFSTFDIDVFAAAIAALQDDAARGRVLAVQHQMLARYTPNVIRSQMHRALATLTAAGRAQALNETLPRALVTDASATACVVTALAAVQSAGPASAPAIHDSGENLLSLYDIAIYRRFFDALKKQRFAAFEAQGGRGGLTLDPAMFEFRFGTIDNGALRLPAARYPSNHLIFGPFIELPAGEYEAAVQLTVIPTGEGVQFEIDVNTHAHGVVAKRTMSVKELAAAAVQLLRFVIPAGSAVTEFRIRPLAPFNGQLDFGGVTIRRAHPASVD